MGCPGSPRARGPTVDDSPAPGCPACLRSSRSPSVHAGWGDLTGGGLGGDYFCASSGSRASLAPLRGGGMMPTAESAPFPGFARAVWPRSPNRANPSPPVGEGVRGWGDIGGLTQKPWQKHSAHLPRWARKQVRAIPGRGGSGDLGDATFGPAREVGGASAGGGLALPPCMPT